MKLVSSTLRLLLGGGSARVGRGRGEGVALVASWGRFVSMCRIIIESLLIECRPLRFVV